MVVSQQVKKIFLGQAGLFKDRLKGAALEVSIMIGDGYPQLGLFWMPENIVAPAGVVNEKACS